MFRTDFLSNPHIRRAAAQGIMYARLVFGCIFALGYVILVYDLVAIGRRAALVPEPQLSRA